MFGQGQPFGGSDNTGGTLDKVLVDVIAGQDLVQVGPELKFAVAIDIEEGWHLNVHNPPLDYFIGVELVLSPSNQAMVSDIPYPQLLKKKFSFCRLVFLFVAMSVLN